MSMENAILEHAAALREVAAAIKSMGASVSAGEAAAVVQKFEDSLKGDPKEKEAHEQKLQARAVADGAEQPIAEEIKAVSVEIEAKDSVAPADLDYTKDVRPVLLAVNKKAGQPALKALLNDFGAATGDKLKPEQYGEVLAAANKILAG